MRIAHIVSTYPPYRGGMGNVAYEMVTRLRSRGHTCMVLTPDYGTMRSAVEDVMRIKPWFSFGNAAFMPNLYGHLHGFEVIHLHYPFFGAAETVAYFVNRNPRTRLVVTYHMDTIGSGLKGFIFDGYRRAMMPRILSQADLITVSSTDYGEHSALKPYLGTLNVRELPFGVDERFTPQGRQPSQGGMRLLFVGGLDRAHYFKGLEVLIKALATHKDAAWSLEIVGEGDLRPTYEQQVREKGLEARIKFLGSVSSENLPGLYRNADLTILPSTDRSEAFGLVLLESMASGTPILVSDLPGVRTLVHEGKTGWLVKPNDQHNLAERLAEIIKNTSVLQPMREEANKFVEAQYRWPKIIERLETLYSHEHPDHQ